MDTTVILLATAWATMLLFSVRALVLLPRVRITRRGVFDGSGRLGWIRWDEIEGAYPPRHGEDSVRLRLRVSPRLARRLQTLQVHPRSDDHIDWRLDLSGSDVSPIDLILTTIEQGPQPST